MPEFCYPARILLIAHKSYLAKPINFRICNLTAKDHYDIKDFSSNLANRVVFQQKDHPESKYTLSRTWKESTFFVILNTFTISTSDLEYGFHDPYML